MNSLSTPLRCVLALVSLCAAPALWAAEPTRIEPLITSNGTVVLEVTRSDPASGGLQDYVIEVSEDLLTWEEIARSSLEAELEVVDREAQGRPARFYRVVGVELSEAMRLFSEELQAEMVELDDYASGIVLHGVTLEEYRELRAATEATRQSILELLDGGLAVPESLLRHFRDSVGRIDQLLAAHPLRLERDGVSYEIEVSKAMQALGQEYGRLGRVSLADYDRLPGVAPEDLEGLERLAAYLESRQVGLESRLPVFEALSPWGHFELTWRLVDKHLDLLAESAEDLDNDGVREIDYAQYRRALNGMERLWREGEALAAELRLEYPWDEGVLAARPIETAALGDVLTAMDAYLAALEEALEAKAREQGWESVFEAQALAEARQLWRQRAAAELAALDDTVKQPSVGMELFPAFPGTIPSSPATSASLLTHYEELAAWKEELETNATAFFEDRTLSDWMRERVEAAFEAKLNGFYYQSGRHIGLYESVFLALANVVQAGELRFAYGSGGGEEAVLEASDGIAGGLPRSVEALLEFPGVAAALSAEELEAFVFDEEWLALQRVAIGSEGSGSGANLSLFAIRIQLMDALLQQFGEALLVEGFFEIEAFAAAVAFGPVMEPFVSEAALELAEAQAALQALELDASSGIAPHQFEGAVVAIESLRERWDALGEAAAAEAGSGQVDLFRSLLEARLEEFVDSLESQLGETEQALWTKIVRIEIEDTEYLIHADWMRRVMNRIVGRVAVARNQPERYRREQWARLNGISEEDMLELRRAGTWSRGWLRDAPQDDEARASLLQSTPQDFEFYLIFAPRLLEGLGEAALDGAGNLDDRLIEAALMAGVEAGTPAGQSIVSASREIADEESQAALQRFDALDFSRWQDWAEGEAELVALKRRIASRVAPFVEGLSVDERSDLAWALRYRQANPQGDYRRVLEQLEAPQQQSVFTVGEASGASWKFDYETMSQLLGVWRVDDPEWAALYPGVTAEDLAAGRQLVPDLVFTQDGVLDDDALYRENIDNRKLLLAILERVQSNPGDLPARYREDWVVDGKVNEEVFRRYLKGVDARHEEVVASAESLVKDGVKRLRSMPVEPLTVARIEALYAELLQLREALVEMIREQTRIHDAGDVVEMEEAVTEVYADAVGVVLDAMRSYPLAVSFGGPARELPFEAIQDALLEELEARFPGESIAAHHFASFYGISVADLRQYDTLEAFFGAQIVALPEHSESVEVVSKLSDIGMRQLVSDLLQRFGAEVVDAESGTVNSGLLLELLSDEALGLERAFSVVDQLFDAATQRLEALGMAKDLETLEAINGKLSRTREDVAERLADEVTALSDANFSTVQQRMDQRYEAYKGLVAELAFGLEMRIDLIDGGTVAVDLAVHEAELRAIFEDLVAKYAEDDATVGETEPVSLFDPWYRLDGRARPSFQSEHTPTRLGFYLLVGRLIAAYGETVVSEGAFDLEAFAQELEREDSQRAYGLIDRLASRETAAFNALLPSHSDAIPVEEARTIGEAFDASHAAFARLYRRLPRVAWFRGSGFRSILSERWAEQVAAYEGALSDRDVIVELQGEEIALPVGTMVEAMDAAYAEGNRSLLDAVALGEESEFQYGTKRILRERFEFPIGPVAVTTFATATGPRATLETPPEGFTLGDLLRLPGVRAMDLSGLDTLEEDQVELLRVDAEARLAGRLNLRSLAPGSGVSVVGRMNSVEMGLPGWDDSWIAPIHYKLGPAESYGELSWRAKRFEVLVELAIELAEQIVGPDDELDLEAFAAALRGGS